MYRMVGCALALGGLMVQCSLAQAQVVVPWALRSTVDTDGDTVPNLVDNAPGVANNQADSDADLIGDVIDPTPMTSNPLLPPFVVGIPPTTPISAGSNAAIDYLVFFGSAAGDFGHIDIDFGGNGIFDATYFGPLTSSINQIVIPPSLFVDSTWNLNQAGNYTFHLLGFAPGFNPLNSMSVGVSISNQQVIPEPASAVLLCVAVGIAAVSARRCCGTKPRFSVS